MDNNKYESLFKSIAIASERLLDATQKLHKFYINSYKANSLAQSANFLAKQIIDSQKLKENHIHLAELTQNFSNVLSSAYKPMIEIFSDENYLKTTTILEEFTKTIQPIQFNPAINDLIKKPFDINLNKIYKIDDLVPQPLANEAIDNSEELLEILNDVSPSEESQQLSENLKSIKHIPITTDKLVNIILSIMMLIATFWGLINDQFETEQRSEIQSSLERQNEILEKICDRLPPE